MLTNARQVCDRNVHKIDVGLTSLQSMTTCTQQGYKKMCKQEMSMIQEMN